jgi:hypothetical protein
VARGVEYTTFSEAKEVPTGAQAAFLKMSRKTLRAHQEEGLVDMIIGRDELPIPGWPGSSLLLMRTEFAPRYVVRNLAELGRRRSSPG